MMNSVAKYYRELDESADRSGAAIVIIDENSAVLHEANDNSMCRLLSGSADFSADCAKFCGRAFEWTRETDEKIEYKCYAGLNCMAVSMKNKKSVAIVGRVFLQAEDYRAATERAAGGDWQQFPASEFFGNTLFGGTLEDLGKIADEAAAMTTPDDENQTAEIAAPTEPTAFVTESAAAKNEVADRNAPVLQDDRWREWRSLFESFLKSDYRAACRLIVEFVRERHALSNVTWLEREGNQLIAAFEGNAPDETDEANETGETDVRFNIATDDVLLRDAVRTNAPLELRGRPAENAVNDANARTAWLFPLAVDGEVRGALVVTDELNDDLKRRITRFNQKIASRLEILRLRDQLAKLSSIERAVEKFNANLRDLDSDDFWTHLVTASAELMCAERSSLLLYDEKSQAFTTKAATGIKADYLRTEQGNLGGRVARKVLRSGKAVVVRNVGKTGLRSAPDDWLYKSNSFISYPITLGGRKIGVLNLTDQADGQSYDQSDLKLLDAVMPSLAVMIDRADLKHQAGEFRQLSVTDALTGLLNRRYLEERLTEEIKRSNRHGFPMSFLMIDVDEFKSYNDNFGHTEGDIALRTVGACLKENLRGADVAARYGGEEFSILLPQTNSTEAAVIAERVRERVENERFKHRQITVSIGIASCSLSLNSSPDLIAAADKALYAAKREGRNVVRVFENIQKTILVETGKSAN